MNAVAYNVYIAPVLQYVAQLLVPAERILDAESKALRKLAPGPGNWIVQRDLENLTQLGFKYDFRTISSTAMAAKLRVMKDTAPDAKAKRDQLRNAYLDAAFRPFGYAIGSSFVYILAENLERLQACGVECNPSSTQSRLQISIKAALQPYDAIERIRQKIQRWKLEGAPGHLSRRIHANLDAVGKLCRPCTTSAMLRTIWNGWPTSARMRTLTGAPVGKCVLGCEFAEDRVEHYLLCEKVWAYLLRPVPQGLGMRPELRNHTSMLLAACGLTEADKVTIVVAVYAISRAVHVASQCSRKLNPRALLALYAADALRGSKARILLKRGDLGKRP